MTKLGFAKYDKANYEYSYGFAIVIGTYLPRSYWYVTNFNGWKCIKGVYASGTYLIDAILINADLRDANLSGADLSFAYLIDADLRDAVL